MAHKKVIKGIILSLYGALWALLIPVLATIFGKPFIWLEALYYVLIIGLAGCCTTLVFVSCFTLLKTLLKKGIK